MNIIHYWFIKFCSYMPKGPERRSGDQKKNRNGVPVRSGSKRTLMLRKLFIGKSRVLGVIP